MPAREAPVQVEKDRALTVRLPEPLLDQLKRRAEAEERTVAGILRIAAKQYLSNTPEPIF